MGKKSTYRVPLRRRREGKTDYHARKAMVVSERPRLVPRFSAKNVSVQIIASKLNGDIVLASAHSRELKKKYGWKAPTGNIPAAYLTGLICGLKAKNNAVDNAILDIGLLNPTKGSKIFAVLSGVVDAGISVPHNENKIIKERLEGKHIEKYSLLLETDSEDYSAKFSKYLEQKIPPQDISNHFTKIKSAIISSYTKGDKQT